MWDLLVDVADHLRSHVSMLSCQGASIGCIHTEAILNEAVRVVLVGAEEVVAGHGIRISCSVAADEDEVRSRKRLRGLIGVALIGYKSS